MIIDPLSLIKMKSNFKKKRDSFFLPVFKLGGASNQSLDYRNLIDQNFPVLLYQLVKIHTKNI